MKNLIKNSLLFTMFLFLTAFTQAPGEVPPAQDETLFKESKGVDPERAKEQLQAIYLKANKTQTLFCACDFDEGKQLDPAKCGYTPKRAKGKRARTMDWQPAMTPFQYGKVLKCWSERICKRHTGRPFAGPKCCEKVEPVFMRMQADMHNLFPVIGELARDRANKEFSEIKGEKRKYGQCDFEVRRQSAEPAENIRGDIARAYFYMSQQYKVPLRKKQEDLFIHWHVTDPPDRWEMDRNSAIEEIQGNRNPFIDHPELAERVKDF